MQACRRGRDAADHLSLRVEAESGRFFAQPDEEFRCGDRMSRMHNVQPHMRFPLRAECRTRIAYIEPIAEGDYTRTP
jgi:hypothetical protein